MARSTIGRGLKDLDAPTLAPGQVRRPGSCREPVRESDATLLADATGLTIQVSHYPPGTSNWNRIEHRLFCNISQTWHGKSLVNRLAVVELIAATTTTTGLTVDCVPDPRRYAKGIQVSDAEMACLNIQSDEFHPEWNYTIPPRRQA